MAPSLPLACLGPMEGGSGDDARPSSLRCDIVNKGRVESGQTGKVDGDETPFAEPPPPLSQRRSQHQSKSEKKEKREKGKQDQFSTCFLFFCSKLWVGRSMPIFDPELRSASVEEGDYSFLGT